MKKMADKGEGREYATKLYHGTVVEKGFEHLRKQSGLGGWRSWGWGGRRE